jgi:hypothetical protein
MGIPVKATCSECLTTHRTTIEFGQENIKCPACGHSMKNLPEGELNQMDLALKSQRMNQIVALIAFAVALGAVIYWTLGQSPTATEIKDDFMSKTGWPALACVGLLVSIIFGALGSRRRFIVEF